jgi:hypothetical protein
MTSFGSVTKSVTVVPVLSKISLNFAAHVSKGHNFKERKFTVAAKPTEPARCKKIPKTKHQELDDTISSCSLKEKEEDDKENATNFSMCSEENSYTSSCN